jgi:hypothetical protein
LFSGSIFGRMRFSPEYDHEPVRRLPSNCRNVAWEIGVSLAQLTGLVREEDVGGATGPRPAGSIWPETRRFG